MEPTLTDEQSVHFITQLSTDDDFRASLIADPAAHMLEHYGVTLEPEQIPDHVQLPSKEEIANNLDAHVSKLHSYINDLGWIFFIK